MANSRGGVGKSTVAVRLAPIAVVLERLARGAQVRRRALTRQRGHSLTAQRAAEGAQEGTA